MLALAQATPLAERRTARRAEDLQQTLALAKLAIALTEQALAKLPAAASADSASAARALALQRSELLAALPLPFSLQWVDAQGQVVRGDRLGQPALPNTSRPSLQRPAPAGSPDRWQVGRSQGLGR